MANPLDEKLAAAAERAENSRAQFKSQISATKDRLAPEQLKQDALQIVDDYVEQGKQATLDTMKAHPVVFASSFLGTLAFWYRKPLIEKTPDALDSVGNGLAKLRDTIAPDDWQPMARFAKSKKPASLKERLTDTIKTYTRGLKNGQ